MPPQDRILVSSLRLCRDELQITYPQAATFEESWLPHKFPPEVRNPIYEYVFEDFNHAILVTHTAASTDDGRPMNASPRMGTNDSVFFCNIPSIQLLRCCLQIYREGMGVILYGTTVMFKNRRNCFPFRDRDHLPFVRSWLKCFGSEIPLLRAVVVDLSVPTLPNHNDHDKRIDLLPLLSSLVGSPQATLWVDFTLSPQSPPIPSIPDYIDARLRLGSSNWRSPPDQDLLEGTLYTLVRQDPLNLRRLGDLGRYLSCITVDRSVIKGNIRWRTITGCLAPNINFKVPEDSWAIHKRHIHSTSNLFALPPDVLGTICEHALSLLESIVVVLGSKTSISPKFLLLKLVKERPRLLGVVVPSIYTSNTFTFITNLHTKRATYGDMSHLFFWLRMDVLDIRTAATTTSETFHRVREEAKRRHGRRLARATARAAAGQRKMLSVTFSERVVDRKMMSWRLAREARQRRNDNQAKAAQTTATKDARTILRWMKAVQFEFRFDLCERTSLESLRISIIDLLKTTTWDEPFTATIKCVLTCLGKDGRTAHYESAFTLRHVQLNTFVILSHVLQAQPGRLRWTCPNVYINGFGIAVEITYPNKPRGPRFHHATHDMSNPTKAEERGKHYARWLKHLVPVGGKSWKDKEMTDDENRVPGSLIRVWDDLRIALWGEGLRAAW